MSKSQKFTLASKNIYQDDYFTQYIEELASIIANKQKVLLEKCRENNVNLLDVHKAFALKDVNSVNEKAEVVAFIEKVKAPKPMAFPTT